MGQIWPPGHGGQPLFPGNPINHSLGVFDCIL